MSYTVRPIQKSDLETIMNWRMSPEVTAYLFTNPKLTIEKQKKWFESISKNQTVKYWIIEVNNEPAGVINLADINYKSQTTTWAYYIGNTNLRSMQLAISLELSLYEYVFEKMNFEKIYGEVLSANSGVVKLHQLCGCRVENIVKDEVEKEGKKYDVTHLIITKDEWYQNKHKYRYEHISFN